MITQTYYISSGRKNAMFTLRCRRDGTLLGSQWAPDFYVCNLAATEEKAQEKAATYFAAMRERIADTDGFKLQLDLDPGRELNKRRGKLSAKDTTRIEMIEGGAFPFGKHVGTRIEDAPDSYLLYMADKSKDENEPVFAALTAVCMGFALSKGLIAKREEKRDEQAKQDALSDHIGAVGKRMTFEGFLYVCYEQANNFGGTTWIQKIRIGNDIVTYFGSRKLGEKGTIVSFSATVKEHSIYNGIRTTRVMRPT